MRKLAATAALLAVAGVTAVAASHTHAAVLVAPHTMHRLVAPGQGA